MDTSATKLVISAICNLTASPVFGIFHQHNLLFVPPKFDLQSYMCYI